MGISFYGCAVHLWDEKERQKLLSLESAMVVERVAFHSYLVWGHSHVKTNPWLYNKEVPPCSAVATITFILCTEILCI